ncbi:hypothetical protein HPB52_023591 [Rhipicephalus sanguineus]|uniref:Uncharacterized protein n=1 Tax=Rhipicephalus sanguineus TaxID=34632 RepID=A0A9D4PNN0_RHISA|nr:hypothetical protein HPB52_023591 [Rhipicephalus sanguineus]
MESEYERLLSVTHGGFATKFTAWTHISDRDYKIPNRPTSARKGTWLYKGEIRRNRKQHVYCSHSSAGMLQWASVGLAQRGKKFCELHLCKLMCGVLTNDIRNPNATLKDAEKAAMTWFRHAAERLAAQQK